jgi:SLT domain-containing protein
MRGQLAGWPTKESTNVVVTGSGGAAIRSSVPGVSGGSVSVTGVPITGPGAPLGLAGGGVLPGFSPGHDSVMAMLSPGEGILTPQAVRMIGPGMVDHINRQAKHFADGGLVMPNVSGFAHNYLNTMTRDIDKSFASVLNRAVSAVAGNSQQALNGMSIPGHPSGSLIGWIAKALALTGAPSSWAPDLGTIALYESGWNPNAINLSDVNAKNGDPSRGLMQVIMSTFLGYHQAGTSFNIYDPVANIAAAIRYIEAQYGSVFNVPGILSLEHGGKYVGYDSGGYLMPGLTLAYNGTGKPEMVSPNGGGAPVELHLHGDLAMDGLWDRLQVKTAQYNLRNSGRVNGGWSPL